MAIQTINLGTQPSGTGGDTNRSANVKINENFSNKQHAASRMVGLNEGDVLEVNAYGIGAFAARYTPDLSEASIDGANIRNGLFGGSGLTIGTEAFTGAAGVTLKRLADTGVVFYSNVSGSSAGTPSLNVAVFNKKLMRTAPALLLGINCQTDSNGFIKKASPIIQLYATMIKPNAEAAEQKPIFEKVDTGHYLIKGTQGFATEGWWIEVPADTNGNKICAVQYQTLENGDLEIKTFKKKLNDEGDIVPNLDAPIDIPNNANGEPRWIDIRLNPLPPKPIIEQVPRTKKQAKMMKQIKYSMQPTYMTKLTDLIDDKGQLVMVNGKAFQKQETYMVTDSQGMVTLTNQPVINEQGETVFEFVQMVDADGQPVFEDVPVLDAEGNQIFDEVIHEPEQ